MIATFAAAFLATWPVLLFAAWLVTFGLLLDDMLGAES